MRRIIAVILCILLLSTTVFADNAAASYSSTAAVNSTGSCQISLSLNIRLDTPVNSLTFPLGSDVSSVSVNGGRASLTAVGNVTHIKLTHLNNQAGTFPLSIQYVANNVISLDDDNKQFVSIPILTGFKYPVESLQFSITMPGEFDQTPEFLSGYHGQDIEKSMSFSVSGTTISGSTTEPLKDSETLYMKLYTPEGMFPLAARSGETLFFDHLAMALFVGLALLYWLITMRRKPFWVTSTPNPPGGLSAGNIGSYLVHAHADLSMMVIQWAQMGYLEIHVDKRSRIFLHKKMEMGNERSAFESKCFSILFPRKHPMIEATSTRYAHMCHQVAASSRRRNPGLQPRSGSPVLFRILACIPVLFAGIAIGDCIHASSPEIKVLWMVVMAIAAAFSCWHIQQGMFWMYLRNRQDLFVSCILSAAVLMVSLLCDAIVYGAIAVFWAILSGLMAAYGGKRSESGKQICTGILGLRRYLCSTPPSELQRILRCNPEFYYELAPFALALGVDRQFAKQFGSAHLPSCKWLLTPAPSPRTPDEWYPLLRQTVRLMKDSQPRPLWKKLLNIR